MRGWQWSLKEARRWSVTSWSPLMGRDQLWDNKWISQTTNNNIVVVSSPSYFSPLLSSSSYVLLSLTRIVYAISFQLPMDHPAAKGLTKTQSIMGQGIRFVSKLNDPKVTISLDIAIPYPSLLPPLLPHSLPPSLPLFLPPSLTWPTKDMVK